MSENKIVLMFVELAFTCADAIPDTWLLVLDKAIRNVLGL